jgi:hypothetical protein
MNIWDEEAVDQYEKRMALRLEQERIEAENIKAFIEAGQP